MKTWIRLICCAVLLLGLAACGGSGSSEVVDSSDEPSPDPISLPSDAGGTHTAVVNGTTTSPYGHYLYLPDGYSADGSEYPLLIFLHGSGEKGDSTSDAAVLDKVLRNGPPKLIERESWDPATPMIVASPQSPVWWNPTTLDDFIDYLRSTYAIDASRIYLTGLSMGGFGTFDYLTAHGTAGQVAAAVPICGGGKTGQADQMAHIPVWAFHGDADGTVNINKSISMIDAVNAASPAYRAKLTVYPGVGHNSWARTYDGSGMGTESPDYDPFDPSITDWMLQYRRVE